MTRQLKIPLQGFKRFFTSRFKKSKNVVTMDKSIFYSGNFNQTGKISKSQTRCGSTILKWPLLTNLFRISMTLSINFPSSLEGIWNGLFTWYILCFCLWKDWRRCVFLRESTLISIPVNWARPWSSSLSVWSTQTPSIIILRFSTPIQVFFLFTTDMRRL